MAGEIPVIKITLKTPAVLLQGGCYLEAGGLQKRYLLKGFSVLIVVGCETGPFHLVPGWEAFIRWLSTSLTSPGGDCLGAEPSHHCLVYAYLTQHPDQANQPADTAHETMAAPAAVPAVEERSKL